MTAPSVRCVLCKRWVSDACQGMRSLLMRRQGDSVHVPRDADVWVSSSSTLGRSCVIRRAASHARHPLRTHAVCAGSVASTEAHPLHMRTRCLLYTSPSPRD
eukprot:15436641-Alexandrium_andersonii.AAC.2